MKKIYSKELSKKLLLYVFSLVLVIALVTNIELVYATSATHLKKTSIVLTVGEAYVQKLISSKGEVISSESLIWKSNDKDIATISKSGKIVSKKVGTTSMTAKYKNKTYKFTVKVKKATLNNTKKSIFIGAKTTLKLYDANDKQIDSSKLTFKTSDKTIATVTSKGVVKGKKSGTATITVIYKGKSYKAKINVKSKISVTDSSVTLDENKSVKIKIKTDKSLSNIYSQVISGGEYIETTWGSWDGVETYLKIKGTNDGVAKIKIWNADCENDYKYITVKVNRVGSNIDIDEEPIIMHVNQNIKIPIKTTVSLRNIKYLVEQGANYIEISRGAWDGNDTYLQIKAVHSGTVAIKIWDADSEDDYKYILVTINDVGSNISVDKDYITIEKHQSTKVIVKTTDSLKSISYKVINGSNLVEISKGSWDGNNIYLLIDAIEKGTAKVKIWDTDNEKDYLYITIKIEDIAQDNSTESEPNDPIDEFTKLDRMAACGINQAYISAKYPSTLHLNSITYSTGEVNGYGDIIDRMVLRCYSANSLGGYGDIYVVVLRCDSGINYPKSTYYPGYGYIVTSAYSGDPGLEYTLYDNEAAVKAYNNFYNTDRVIPYD